MTIPLLFLWFVIFPASIVFIGVVSKRNANEFLFALLATILLELLVIALNNQPSRTGLLTVMLEFCSSSCTVTVGMIGSYKLQGLGTFKDWWLTGKVPFAAICLMHFTLSMCMAYTLSKGWLPG